MNLADTATLPPTLNSEQAAELLGVSVDHLWKLRRDGQAPVEPLQLGRTLRWPTAPLLVLLGVQRSEADPEVDLTSTITPPTPISQEDHHGG